MRRKRLAVAWQALAYLLRLAREGGGYEWRGVRGWAVREDVQAATGLAGTASLLTLVHGNTRWVEREDVRHPARTVPVWIYRITDEGARALDGDEPGAPLPPVDRDAAPEPGRFYLPPHSADALGVLQHEAERPTAPAYVEGETGWLSMYEVTDRTERLGPGRRALSDDLRLLMRAGLVETRRSTLAGAHPYVLYRVTEAGAQARPLGWREPGERSAEPMAQPRIPLPAASPARR